jgi:hypothetical protein
MRVTMMLADHAQVADGKLFISGGGWTICGPGATPASVAVIFHVPWQDTNKKIEFSLRLTDEDGYQVSQPGPRGTQPIQAGGQFEAGRPPGVAPGTEISVPMSFNIILQLPAGGRYTWILAVDGEEDNAWRLSFVTRQAPTANGPSAPPGPG